MNVTPLAIADGVLIEPNMFGDERGFFFKSSNHARLEEAFSKPLQVGQDNSSRGVKAALRGLHYQIRRYQDKLVRVAQFKVFDVAVDLSRSSKTFRHWIGRILTADNKSQLWIPKGFAHDFVLLSDTAKFLRKTTDYYAPAFERCVAWDDPAIGICWPNSLRPQPPAKDLARMRLAKAGEFA